MAISMLPNNELEQVSVYPNEYVTNITINRGITRLLENDIFLYRMLADVEGQIGPWEYGLSAWNFLGESSGNWDAATATVSGLSADWVLHDRYIDTSSAAAFPIPARGSGLYNHVPVWNSATSQWLDRGYSINDKNTWVGTPVDDISGHYFIPTNRTVYDLFTSISVSGLVQIGDVNAGEITVWNSDGVLRSDGISVNNTTALSAVDTLVPTQNIVKDYSDGFLAGKVLSAPTGNLSVPIYNISGDNVTWGTYNPDQWTWKETKVYSGCEYNLTTGYKNLLELQWPESIEGMPDYLDYPITMNVVAQCRVLGFRDTDTGLARPDLNNFQSSYRRLSLGFLWSGRCYDNSGGLTTWNGLGTGTKGWVSRSNPAYDTEGSGYSTGGGLGVAASDWTWLTEAGYPYQDQPSFAAGSSYLFMTSPREWLRTAVYSANPTLGYFRIAPSVTYTNVYWSIKLEITMDRVLGLPGAAAVEPYYPEGVQTIDLNW